MAIVGKVESVWRYPVKSMRGEELESAFVGFAGIYGDRVFAFTSTLHPTGFPWVTARTKRQMLLHRPRFRRPAEMQAPPNLTEAQQLGSGLTPLYGDGETFAVDVETPAGEVLAINDPELAARLAEGGGDVVLVRSDRAMTDCRPISLVSLQTVAQLGNEIGVELDPRRFRANLCLDLEASGGFAEDDFVGRTLKVGSRTLISVLQRDARCKMISIDPDTAEEDPEILATVSRTHGGDAGVYGAVLGEGIVRPGDPVKLMDQPLLEH